MHAAITGGAGQIFMTLLRTNRRNNFQSFLVFLIGNLGAMLGAWIIKGDLDHRYPFKIMNVPPPNYYVEISNYLVVLAVAIALLTSFVFFFWIKVRGSVAGFVSLVMCPLVFSLGLWAFTAMGPYRDQLDLPLNFDASTATQRHQEFYKSAGEEFFFSLVVFVMAYVCIKVVSLIASRRKFLR